MQPELEGCEHDSGHLRELLDQKAEEVKVDAIIAVRVAQAALEITEVHRRKRELERSKLRASRGSQGGAEQREPGAPL